MQERRRSRRHLLNTVRILLMVLGPLCMLFAFTALVLALLREKQVAENLRLMGVVYLGAGSLCLLVYFLLGRFGSSRRSDKQPSRRRPVHPAPPTNSADASSQSGMVLILTLVLLGLMAALALHLQYATRMAQRTDARSWQRARLRTALTDEALDRVRELARDEHPHVDAPGKAWMDALRETERPDGITTLSRITDLNRYIDLNNLVLDDDFPGVNQAERFLTRAMTHAGDSTPMERIEPLTDWMDPSEDARETEAYATHDPPYQAPGASLQSWGELRWIAGFSPDYFARKPSYRAADIIDLVGIVPGPRERPVPVNINTASPAVLESIFGAGQETVARYIVLTREETPFTSIDALMSELDPSLFQHLRPFLSVRSTHFLIEVQAVEEGHAASLRALAARDRSGTVRIMQWVL